MRIALLGTHGVPPGYGGFETCVEELGRRLVDRGHEVTVYCRTHHVKAQTTSYRGMRQIRLPTIRNKYLDTLVHSYLSSIHAMRQGYDIALYFISGNSPVTWMPRLVGTKTILNVDGLDWKREKWPRFAKLYIQLAEFLATKLPNAYITDSRVVQSYYMDRFKSSAPYIPYGSDVARVPAGETLRRFGLDADRYVLFVGRLVPENCAHHLVAAFRDVSTDMSCVIVGDAPYADGYKSYLKGLAAGDRRIVFTGYVFGRGYQELGTNAALFVGSSGVGGTHPAFIEAMAFGTCVVFNNTPENLETVGDAGLPYDGKMGAKSLRPLLQCLVDQPERRRTFASRGCERAADLYSWETVTDAYEQLFYRVRGDPAPQRLQLTARRR